MKNKGIIFYTDSRLDEKIASPVRGEILKSNLPIVSVSLKPLNFGQNIVLDLEPGIMTYLTQILTALEASTADFVFFCEHDVLYSQSHFDFNPPWDDIFYYNINVWRWDYPKNRAITYDALRSLSGMCCGRELAIRHYKERIRIVEKTGWMLKYGFEPGTKRRKRGGISDDFCEDWWSKYPNIDIRHKRTISPRKCSLDSFKHKPSAESWKEVTLDKIPGWNLKDMFGM